MSRRRRNYWGWGYEDRSPTPEKQGQLMAMGGALLGVELAARPMPTLDAARLPTPSVEVPAELSGFATADHFERAVHCYGRSFRDIARGFAGDFASAPDLVCSPRNEEELERAMEWCAAKSVAMIPYGGGTSVVGGVEADVPGNFRGALSLDMREFAAVEEIDDVSRSARIGAGALGPDLERALGARGFSLRHYPQSFEMSTLGGWLATRAGGHFATLATHIDDMVESIRMVSPSGRWQSRRLPASGAGPSPDRMVLGSEGTLGVITEAWMRILPRPRWRASAAVRFSDWDAVVSAARDIAQSGLYPSNCRVLDAREAMLNQVISGGGHVLLLGFESADHPLEPWIERALAIATGHGGECPDGPRFRDSEERAGGEAENWRAAFIDAPYLFNTLVSVGAVVDTFETACTWAQFPELHATVIREVRAVMKEVCGSGFLTCRFTHVYPDGPAPYFTFIAPGKSGGEIEQWSAIKRAALDAVLGAGGTVTHHHAVGRAHREHYRRQRPEPYGRVLAAVKRELDPGGILNRAY